MMEEQPGTPDGVGSDQGRCGEQGEAPGTGSEWVSSDRDRKEVTHFLGLLDAKIEDLKRLAARAEEDVYSRKGRTRFSDFSLCRDVAAECWAFSIVIERRIELYRGPEQSGFQEEFDRLTVAVWSMLLETSLRFLDVLSQETHLPLGSREIFVREIKTLYDSQRLLHDPRYGALIDEGIRRRQDQAARILETIIERAPALLDFSLS